MTPSPRHRSSFPWLRTLGSYASIAAGALGLAGGRPLRGPLYAQIGVADPCNHRCSMCAYHPPDVPRSETLHHFGGAAPALMTLERYRAVVADLAHLGTRRVDLVGRGEPTLHPDLAAMVAIAREAGLEVILTTNGSRLDAALTAALRAAGLDAAKISLNAGRASTYPKIHANQTEADHRAVLDGVRRLVEGPGRRPHVTLSFTVSSLNYDELPEMVERAREAGADAAYFQHVLPMQHMPTLPLSAAALDALETELVPRAMDLARRHGIETNLQAFRIEARQKAGPDAERATGAVPCYVGYYFTAILGNGHVMPCCQTAQSLGNVNDRPFAEIWRSEPYQRFRAAARRLPERGPELETAECETCYFRPHNVSVGRLGRSAGPGAVAFSPRQALRMLRLDGGEARGRGEVRRD